MSDDNKKSKGAGGGIGALSVISIGCGVVHGFCDAQNRNLDSTLENTLTYGPTIVQGAIGAIIGLVGGAAVGGVVGYEATDNLAGAATGVVIGAPAGTAIIGALGAGIGALETLVGYGVGYGVGAIFR